MCSSLSDGKSVRDVGGQPSMSSGVGAINAELKTIPKGTTIEIDYFNTAEQTRTFRIVTAEDQTRERFELMLPFAARDFDRRFDSIKRWRIVS